MVEGPWTRWFLRATTALVLAFIYFPLVIITLYAFNANTTQSWPIQDWTTKWFSIAFHDEDVRDAFFLSIKAAILATAVALVLGTLLALAMARFSFFGRNALTFLVVLPIALPGIITGIALNATITTILQPIGITFGLATIVVGHATFCIVLAYNNVVARLRQTSRSFEEASADLGADSWTTFRRVIVPSMGTALLAGGLLAFGLSFDEVIVTVFTSGAEQTLPIWIFTNLARPQQLPVINVVAFVVVLISILPVYAAQRLAGGTGLTSERPVRGTAAESVEVEP
jgi:putative spermidine/putrescine transport system permease protein